MISLCTLFLPNHLRFQCFLFLNHIYFVYVHYVNQILFSYSIHYDQNSYVDKTGMRVIVGHYVGGNSGGNLSEGTFKY